jgi:flagellar biosynthesis/type III secretory pathway chaperone
VTPASPGTPSPIVSVGEAERAIANLNKIMDRLVETVEEETARLRVGELRATVELDGAKAELARLYAAETDRVKAAKVIIIQSLPEALDRLRQRHTVFQTLLQTNLTVLATAHAVSEGIIRGVSSELARRQAPSTYGASGRANAPSTKTSQPLAVSRRL